MPNDKEEKNGMRRVLLSLHSGTYGRTDDVVGAFILADTLLTKGIEVTILLRGDGVYAAQTGQRPRTIGMDSHIDHLQAAVEMGASVLVVAQDLKTRNMTQEDLVEYAKTIDEKELAALMVQHEHWIPF
jgi:sulfur relay (sulfurtransferase) DsrF/TusC family protein